MKTSFFKYLLLLVAIAFYSTLSGKIIEPVFINEDFTRLSLNGHYTIFHTPEKLSAAEIYEIFKEKYNIHNTPAIESPSLDDFHWLFFTIENTTGKDKELVIDFNNAHVDTIEFFRIIGDTGTPERIGFAGDKMPFFAREGINRRFVFDETIPPKTKYDYLLKIDQRYSTVSYPLVLWTKDSFLKAENLETIILSLYFGGLIFIALFSFATGYVIKQRLFKYYAVYTVMMGLFQSANLGLLFKHFYPYSPALANMFHVFMVPIMLGTFIEFSIQFLKIRKKSRQLDIAVYIYYLLIGLFFILMAFIYEPDKLIVFSLYVHVLIVITVIFILIFSILAYRSPLKKLALTYIAADSVLIIGGIIMLLDDGNFIPYRFAQSRAMIFGSMLELTIFTFAIIISVRQLYDKRNELLQETANHRKKLLQAIVKGRDEEGNRISRDLHDNIGSRLALLKNKILLGKENQTEIVVEITNLSESIRKISHELSPFNALITGLEQRLEQFLKEFSNTTGLKVNFYYNVTTKINDNIAQQIFRIIQEATRNCSKHAQATELNVQIITHEEEISITIDDNGTGFDTTKQATNGNGIQNMISRVESVSGQLEIASTPSEGTHIFISIPLDYSGDEVTV